MVAGKCTSDSILKRVCVDKEAVWCVVEGCFIDRIILGMPEVGVSERWLGC